MKASLVHYIRTGMDADKFVMGICDLFLAAFPKQICSIYLLGSRALGTNIDTSDIDLAVIYKGDGGADKRSEVRQFIRALQTVSPVMLDVAVIDEADAHKGVKAHMKLGRVLTGPDLIKDCPLRSSEELLLLYAGYALHFIRIVRGFPKPIRYPLDYPDKPGSYCGYEANGICVGEGVYRPGFNMLVNLIISIANFRLSHIAGVFPPNKSMTISNYRKHLPSDPWLGLVEGVYDLCRTRLQGRMPETDSDRALLSDLCRRVLEFENDFLRTCIANLGRFAAIENQDLRRQVVDFIGTLESDVAPQAGILADLKRKLQPR